MPDKQWCLSASFQSITMIKNNVLSNDLSVINYCPPMYNKNDFEIITNLTNHQTGKSFLVQTVNTPKKYQYELRIMYKNKIIELNEMALVFYEKKFRPKVRHPFLVNTICTFQDNENLYLISEMPLGGYFFNLLNALGKLSLKATKFYIAEMLLAMHHLHRKGRCYYHLIPSNIMLDKSGHIKLKYDFMNLGGLDDDSYNNNVEYIGIEYILEKKVTFVSDYWSLGVIMYELLFGYSPFRGCTIEETINNVKYSKFTMPPDVDLETEDLIRVLLCRHTFSKMNCMNAFMCIKNHRFFTNIDWYAIENKEILPPLAHMVKPKEVFRGVPMNVFSATKTKKRDHDGYLRLFRSYSFVDDYDCKYEMDLN